MSDHGKRLPLFPGEPNQTDPSRPGRLSNQDSPWVRRRKHDVGIIDERTGYRHTLLLTSGQFGRQMIQAVIESDPVQ